jgi:1-acyl-sn-glycerol-3-phosphate acyltransferase
MQFVRLFYRLTAIALWTLILYLIHLIVKTILTPFKKTRRIWRRFLVKFWARGLAKIMAMYITIKGQPPTPPFFLVSNHLSYLDIILFFTQIHVIFVARGDLQHWPVFNLLIKVADTIFIDRGRKKDVMRVNVLISEAIKNNESIIVFPEGTSSSGEGILRFKPSLFEFPAKNQFPVSYASIHYRTPEHELPAYLSVCWWGDMTFGPHFFDLLKISKFYATIHFGERTITGEERKFLARESSKQIYMQFKPIVTNRETDELGNRLAPPQKKSDVSN